MPLQLSFSKSYMKRILLMSVFVIAFASANEKRFINSSNDGKSNPLLWMIINQISGIDSKITKLQDKDEQMNKQISELNHQVSSVYVKVISKIKTEIKNLQKKHTNDDGRTKQILKLTGDVNKLKLKVKKPCESGWTLFGNHCYMFELSKVSWHAAKKECERRLGHLVKIETSVENSFLTSMVTAYGRGNKDFWIGLNDLTREGWYTWISDYSTVTYTDWLSGNPDNSHGIEDCCEIRGSNWNDVDCSMSYSFICEKQAQIDITTGKRHDTIR
ncbi:CD209 antigen-like protein C [Mytilus californianus]|uniref:CD209 antigen-like protein C n=1 Tax=Mytilus californianus TaxID=6549 RepID=UPI002245D80D|nr:CD209 antigen-like protein C [Mytilus californianus]